MIKNGVEFEERTVSISNATVCIFCGKLFSSGEKVMGSSDGTYKMYACKSCFDKNPLIPAMTGNVISYGGRLYSWIGKGIRGTHKCDITGKIIRSGQPCWWSSAKRGKGQSYLTQEGFQSAILGIDMPVVAKDIAEKKVSLPATILQSLKNRLVKEDAENKVAYQFTETKADSKADKVGHILVAGGRINKSIVGSDVINFFKSVMDINIIDGRRIVDSVTGKCFGEGLFDFVSEDFSIFITVNANENHECHGKRLYNLKTSENKIMINGITYELVDGRWILRNVGR